MNTLDHLRDKLNQLDEKIAILLDDRMEICDQIGKIKKSSHIALTDIWREEEVLQNIAMAAKHPILKETIASIYRTIIETSKITQRFMQTPSVPFQRIGIIGRGLMGGSICKAVKLKKPSVEIRTITQPDEPLTDLVLHSELIILASPISTIIPFAKEIQAAAPKNKNLLVIDIASVKAEIVSAFEELSNGRLEYLGTHPMAGKEKQGFKHSQGTLFTGHPWVITPHPKNTVEAIGQAEELIRFLGAEPVLLNALVHDQQAALVSHLPSLLARDFFEFVQQVDSESVKIAGPGFRSFTRLAHDNPQMRLEFKNYNKKATQKYLRQWLDGVSQRELP